MNREEEIKSIIQARTRLILSAKAAFLNGLPSKRWMEDEKIIKFAEKHLIEDEIMHIAHVIWNDFDPVA